jgi:putative DNA methylase
MLVVAEIDAEFGKVYRVPVPSEIAAAAEAALALAYEAPFGPGVPAVPNEEIAPGNNNIIGPAIYGATSYGDLMVDRQTLAFVRLCRIISDVGGELQGLGMSTDYVRALEGYAGAALVRKIRRSTRGVALQPSYQKITDLYANEGSLVFSYDFFEAGIGEGRRLQGAPSYKIRADARVPDRPAAWLTNNQLRIATRR